MAEKSDPVFELFCRAVDERPEDLERWLSANCEEYGLRAKVRELVERDAGMSGGDTFLKSPVIRPHSDESAPLPERIGAFRIVREIGRGGMGTVYEAVQDRPSRTVALKLIRPEHTTSTVLKRFEHEAEVLGRLDHPGIAHIFEAGVFEPGGVGGGARYPWFAMEYVRGERLDQWAAHRKPTIEERMGVLAAIADALHHAHQKGVIHRDIKPANIVVSERGEPKLLDFGVARLTDEAMRPTGFETGTGRMIGTLAYMSPEQIEGRAEEIDTRTDVYALGVVAYEVLTGRLPHGTAEHSMPATARAILEQVPERPSRYAPELRGDIETVVLKAMAKDRERRYQSASEFGADLRRLLSNQPIMARPPSAMYQLRCFAKRHRGVVVVSGVSVVALVVALIAVSMLAIRLSDAAVELDLRAQIAERESARTGAVTEFLERTLTAADPFADYAAAPDATVSDLLGRSEVWLDTSFSDAPFAEAAARAIVGRTYKGLGNFVDAERQLGKAIERLDLASDSDLQDQDTIRRAGLLAEHAVVLMYLDRQEDALRQLERSEEIAAQIGRVPARDTAVRLGNVGWVFRQAGRLEEAKAAFEEAIDAGRMAGVSADRDRAFAIANLAGLLTEMESYELAVELYAEAEPMIAKIYGAEHPYLSAMSNNIGRLKLAMGDLEGATKAFSEAAERFSTLVGEHHPRTLTALNNLAYAQSEAGEYATAEVTYQKALAGVLAVYGAEHREYRGTLRNYAWFLWEAERYEEASDAWAVVAAGFRGEGEEGMLLGLMYEVYAASLAVMADPSEERIERLIRAFESHLEVVSATEPMAQSSLRQMVAALERAGREDLLVGYRSLLVSEE